MARLDSRGRKIGYNWWREYNCAMLREAETAWQDLKESGEAILYGARLIPGADHNTGYYQLTEKEYRKIRPRPTLKDLLIGNAGMHAEINGHS